MSDSNLIDPAALDRLRQYGGDKLLGQMIRLFLTNSGARMDQIRSGAGEEDAKQAELGSHSLKSSAANVGAEALRQRSAEIEAAAAAGRVDEVGELLPGLEEAYATACAELETIEQGISE